MKSGWRICLIFLPALLAVTGCGTAERPHNIRSVASYYHVRPGDTLYTIAWRYNLDVRDLMGWNRLKPPYTIYPGQRLRLSPPPGYRPVVAQRPERQAPSPRPPRQVATRPPAASPQPATRPAPAPAAQPSKPVKPPKPPKQQSAHKPEPKPARPAEKPPAPKRLVWSWPLKGAVVQHFNPSLPGHQGIRIRGHNGEPVRAVEAGKVVYSGNGLKGYRELIIIQHSPDYLSAYARNRKRLVAEGDVVRRGQKIAELGDPHTNAPELHFELRYRGKPVNPLAYLKGHAAAR